MPPKASEPAIPSLWLRLVSWQATLRGWAEALQAYSRELDSTGRRVLSDQWASPVAAVGEAAAALERWAPPSGGGQPTPDQFAALMAAGDALERASRQLSASSAALLDPGVRAAAATGMSRSYSEDLEDAASEATRASERAGRAEAKALRRASAAGAELGAALSGEALSQAYSAPPCGHGSLATEIYVSSLLCGAVRAPPGEPRREALSRLDSAKDRTLGLPGDGPPAIIADSESLQRYHPLQAMYYAPGPATPAEASRGTRPPGVDLTFPGTHLAVTYDLRRLTDRQRAAEFGGLAPARSGLNWKLVERLRSISATPVPASSSRDRGGNGDHLTPRPALWPSGTPLLVTTDAGATTRELSVSRGGPALASSCIAAGALGASQGDWGPFAGCRPRELRQAAAASSVILEAIRADRAAGWGLDQRARYEAAVAADQIPTGECGPDTLVAALAAGLDRAYGEAPPETPRAYYALVLGHELDPAGWIGEAVSQHGRALVQARLQAELTALGQPRVPFAALAREAHLAAMVQALEAAQDLWKRLRVHLLVDQEAFGLPEPQRRLSLLRDFRRAAHRAVREAPLICAPVPFAYYAASQMAGPLARAT